MSRHGHQVLLSVSEERRGEQEEEQVVFQETRTMKSLRVIAMAIYLAIACQYFFYPEKIYTCKIVKTDMLYIPSNYKNWCFVNMLATFFFFLIYVAWLFNRQRHRCLMTFASFIALGVFIAQIPIDIMLWVDCSFQDDIIVKIALIVFGLQFFVVLCMCWLHCCRCRRNVS